MNPVQRLNKAVEYLKTHHPDLANSDIAVKLGYRSRMYVTDILNGKKPVNDIFLEKLQHEYSIDTQWVLTGKGSMIASLEPSVLYTDEYKDRYIRLLEQQLGTANMHIQQLTTLLEDSLKEISGMLKKK